MSSNWIDEDLYKEIIKVMPIPCLDILVERNGRYLIAKRTQEPMKGKWYMPGSRLLKNETVQEATIRIGLKELGLEVEFDRVLMFYLAYYKNGYFGLDSETATLVVKAKYKSGEVILDKSHDDYMWIDKLTNLHPYVKTAIEEANK